MDTANVDAAQKSRDVILAEREAKKKAKLDAKLKKNKGESSVPTAVEIKPAVKIEKQEKPQQSQQKQDKPQQKPKQEKQKRKSDTELQPKESHSNVEKKKSDHKKSPRQNEPIKQIVKDEIQEVATQLEKIEIIPQKDTKPQLTKAERRAIQEAQRAAKAKLLEEKKSGTSKIIDSSKSMGPKTTVVKQLPKKVITDGTVVVNQRTKTLPVESRVKLFSHLYEERINLDNFNELPKVHPEILKLGIQLSSKIVAGSNARCIALLDAMKFLIQDYVTPPQTEYSRGIDAEIQLSVNFLKKCRPISVSMTNAVKVIKQKITHLDSTLTDSEQRNILIETIETYIRDQIDKAAQAISITVQEKISNGDVILTFGCSSLIQHILLEARRNNVDFRVIVVDARPLNEGQEMLRRLVMHKIKCISVLINAVGFIMPEVTKVLLGAHALLANGYVMSRAGTAQIAMIAKAYNVPVLVCCETHKFSDRVQTDAFVFNEIGDPNDLVLKNGNLENSANNPLGDWATNKFLTPLHLYYDVTPPELVTAVVTEIAILPCTSVPVILRIKPSDY